MYCRCLSIHDLVKVFVCWEPGGSTRTSQIRRGHVMLKTCILPCDTPIKSR
jgi:hypothetical protein